MKVEFAFGSNTAPTIKEEVDNICTTQSYLTLNKRWLNIAVRAVIHRTAPEDWYLKQATVSKESDGSVYGFRRQLLWYAYT